MPVTGKKNGPQPQGVAAAGDAGAAASGVWTLIFEGVAPKARRRMRMLVHALYGHVAMVQFFLAVCLQLPDLLFKLLRTVEQFWRGAERAWITEVPEA
jgi:hypothetical protein